MPFFDVTTKFYKIKRTFMFLLYFPAPVKITDLIGFHLLDSFTLRRVKLTERNQHFSKANHKIFLVMLNLTENMFSYWVFF